MGWITHKSFQMNVVKNIMIDAVEGKRITLDIFFIEDAVPHPTVIYAHGFNGFKDWGNFDLIAKQFAENGFTFIKFNFSHNGTSPEHPEEFVDLEAFGNNNYSKQMEDLRRVINWAADPHNPYARSINPGKISLVGHSMGAGIVLLEAAAGKGIHKLITWAGISVCKTPWGNWPAEKMQEWKEKGVQYYTNSRTGQHMPMYYQLYKDYVEHRDRLDIEAAIKSLAIPILICHGLEDTAVPVQNAHTLQRWQPAAKLFTVAGDHVFGRKHPWPGEELPQPMKDVVNASIQFLKAELP